MNYILEKSDQVPWFTNMRDILHAAQTAAENYDWYVSDIDINFFPDGFSCEDQWMPGEHLATLLRDHDLQFIWAVFSAVPKEFRSIPSSAPYADGNPHFWNGSEPAVQLDGALFEIACWDSSATILINLPAQAAASFLKKYPETKALASARA